MEYFNLNTIVSLTGAITAVCGSILAFQRLSKGAKKDREHEAQKILEQAREEDLVIKSKLESQIDTLNAKIENLELNTEKDLQHIKEIYASDIKSLGEKVDQVREQLNDQHAGVLSLLSK